MANINFIQWRHYRVAVTRCGNWLCHLYFSSKTDDLFLVIPLCKVMTFLAIVSSQLPPSDLVCPVFFQNSDKIFHPGVAPGWCHHGRPPRHLQWRHWFHQLRGREYNKKCVLSTALELVKLVSLFAVLDVSWRWALCCYKTAGFFTSIYSWIMCLW